MANLGFNASVALLSAALSTSISSLQTHAGLPLFEGSLEHSTFTPRADTREWKAIADGIEKCQNEWRSLPSDVEAKVRKISEDLTLDGMKKGGVLLQYVPGGYLLTTITFTPSEDRQGLGSVVSQQTIQQIKTGLAEIGELKKQGYFNGSDVNFGILDNKDFCIAILSVPGEKAHVVPKLNKYSDDFSTPEGRAQIWAESLALMSIGERLSSLKELAIATANFEKLRDIYRDLGDLLSARLTQAVLSKNVRNAEPLLQYTSMGRLSNEELALAPQSLVGRVEFVNFLTRNIPHDTEREIVRSAVSTLELPVLLAGLIDLEERSGFVAPSIADIARIESKSALKYARDEFSKIPNPTLKDGLGIVRSYFETACPSDYRFRDSIQGVATGLALRRTDCSTRGLLAFEMLKHMGFEAGVEIIAAQDKGADVPGVPAHMYNYVVDDTGATLFADYCASADQKYLFANNDEIMSHYVGDSGFTAHVTVHTSNEANVYGPLVREPIVQLIIDFTTAFKASNKDLEPFLSEFPQWKAKVELLKNYSKIQDEIFKTSEADLWAVGTQEAIKALYR